MKFTARRSVSLLPLLALVATGISACSSSSSSSSSADDAGNSPPADASTLDGGDAAPPEAGDNGAPSTTYPAFTVDAPQILGNTAGVIASPKIVTVTWSMDPNHATWEAFDDALGGSAYWQAVGQPYGVGPATSVATSHVEIQGVPPATMTPTDAFNMIEENVAGIEPSGVDGGVPDGGGADGGTGLWPYLGPDTMYVLYLPAATVPDEGFGNVCQSGYTYSGFNFASIARYSPSMGYTDAPFAVIYQCSTYTPEFVEQGASALIVDMATNPEVGGSTPNGFDGFDGAHYAYAVWNGWGENVGDACQIPKSSLLPSYMGLSYGVQRIWSNAAMKAGHDPCVPAPSTPYFGVTTFPAEEQTITLSLAAASQSLHTSVAITQGFAAALNQPVTFQVGFYSDAATSGPWTISAEVSPTLLAYDNAGNLVDNGTATVTIDKTTGVNGEKANVTFTPTKKGELGFHLLTIKSTLDGVDADQPLPIIIADM